LLFPLADNMLVEWRLPVHISSGWPSTLASSILYWYPELERFPNRFLTREHKINLANVLTWIASRSRAQHAWVVSGRRREGHGARSERLFSGFPVPHSSLIFSLSVFFFPMHCLPSRHCASHHFVKLFYIRFLVWTPHFKVTLCLSCGADTLHVGSFYNSEVLSLLW